MDMRYSNTVIIQGDLRYNDYSDFVSHLLYSDFKSYMRYSDCTQGTGRGLVMVQNITDYSYVDMIIITTLSHSLT